MSIRALVVLLALAGCGERVEPPTRAPSLEAPSREFPSRDRSEQLSQAGTQFSSATSEPERAEPPATTIAPRPPSSSADLGSSRVGPRQCARVGAPRSIESRPGVASIVGLSSGYLVAADLLEADGSSIVVSTIDDAGRARALASFSIAPAVSANQLVPPAIARDGNRAAFAYVDAARRVVFHEIDLERRHVGPALLLAQGAADRRFPVALAFVGDSTLVAYTKLGNPQRVEVVRVAADAIAETKDVTPASAGAASPSFVRDVHPPLLTFVDPREALSLSHSVAFDARGKVAAERTLQPILAIASPARVLAVRTESTLELFFVAYGAEGGAGVYRLGASANTVTPTAVVPPSGSSRPWVDALGTDIGIVVAATSPAVDDASNSRIVVRVFDDEGFGPESAVNQSGQSRSRTAFPSLGRDDAGRLALVHGGEDGVSLIRLACRGD